MLEPSTFSNDSVGDSSDEIVPRLKIEKPDFTHLSSVISAADTAPND
jgi:hypothetical protein